MDGSDKKYINSFYDLDVYQRLSRLRKVVLIKIIVKLPPEERYGLIDQMRRACKAACAILAEGFSKRFQINHWKKYLNEYEIAIKQLVKLGKSWINYHQNK